MLYNFGYGTLHIFCLKYLLNLGITSNHKIKFDASWLLLISNYKPIDTSSIYIVFTDYAMLLISDPAKGKCPKDLSMLEFIRPRYCHKEKPYCPRGLICCPCPKTGKKYCIRLRTDGKQLRKVSIVRHSVIYIPIAL